MSDTTALRERIAFLEEENAQLRAAMAPASLTPPEWRLSPSHSRMFAALAARQSVSHDGLLMCCAGPTDGERSNETLRNQVMRLRKRIQPYGYDVVAVWGQGYRLVRPEDRVADVCVGILRSVEREMRAVSQ
mgnify:CR=1 FL=1